MKLISYSMLHRLHLRCIFSMYIFLSLVLPSNAVTSKDAEQNYRKGNYQQAINDYKELLKQGASADIFYNLGNAYYRSGNLTQAILNYERASLLSPGNEDINFNLEFARSKTIDKIVPKGEMFYITWYKSIRSLVSIDSWAYISLISIALAFISVLIYLFSSAISFQKLGFFSSIFLFVLFLLSFVFAFQQKSAMQKRHGAIIMAPSVNVKKSPTFNALDGFVLHEGTRVDIVDEEIKGWAGVLVPDGRSGWVPIDKLEKI